MVDGAEGLALGGEFLEEGVGGLEGGELVPVGAAAREDGGGGGGLGLEGEPMAVEITDVFLVEAAGELVVGAGAGVVAALPGGGEVLGVDGGLAGGDDEGKADAAGLAAVAPQAQAAKDVVERGGGRALHRVLVHEVQRRAVEKSGVTSSEDHQSLHIVEQA